MAKMFTRTITTWKATAYKIDDNLKVIEVGSVEYVSASTGLTEARAALKTAGYEITRGMKITVEKVAEETYGMTVEEFMLHAHRIDRVEVAEQ